MASAKSERTGYDRRGGRLTMNPFLLLLLGGTGYLWFRHNKNVQQNPSYTQPGSTLVNKDNSLTPAGQDLLNQMMAAGNSTGNTGGQ